MVCRKKIEIFSLFCLVLIIVNCKFFTAQPLWENFLKRQGARGSQPIPAGYQRDAERGELQNPQDLALGQPIPEISSDEPSGSSSSLPRVPDVPTSLPAQPTSETSAAVSIQHQRSLRGNLEATFGGLNRLPSVSVSLAWQDNSTRLYPSLPRISSGTSVSSMTSTTSYGTARSASSASLHSSEAGTSAASASRASTSALSSSPSQASTSGASASPSSSSSGRPAPSAPAQESSDSDSRWVPLVCKRQLNFQTSPAPISAALGRAPDLSSSPKRAQSVSKFDRKLLDRAFPVVARHPPQLDVADQAEVSPKRSREATQGSSATTLPTPSAEEAASASTSAAEQPSVPEASTEAQVQGPVIPFGSTNPLHAARPVPVSAVTHPLQPDVATAPLQAAVAVAPLQATVAVGPATVQDPTGPPPATVQDHPLLQTPAVQAPSVSRPSRGQAAGRRPKSRRSRTRASRKREWDLSDESLSPVDDEASFPTRISPRNKKPFQGYNKF